MSAANPVPSIGAVERPTLNLVIVGHVDHGKSTVIGRLLADTGSLPEGKLEAVREQCRRTSKPFEYAFLLDALKDEREQGITIDAARCFFRTPTRNVIIIDAPGHVEFLKNMITGASRADAALLVIDAAEGIRENTKRHGTILSMLGIRQVAVVVNKMDLVGRDLAVFNRIREEYSAFLAPLNVHPAAFIPISAREGENIVSRASWYDGPTILEQVESFESGEALDDRPFRLPVQAVYKFTNFGDDRRIVAGGVESGMVRAGDRVVFHPSGKSSRVASVEMFNRPPLESAGAGSAGGFTLEDELYIKPGEIMARADEPPPVSSTRFHANVFWMGQAPFRAGHRYKFKIGAARAHGYLASIRTVIDAAELSGGGAKGQVDRHDVAECVIETTHPVAFDPASDIAGTGRFVVIDRYEIAGAGIILGPAEGARSVLDEQVAERESLWQASPITPVQRRLRYGHGSKFILLTGRDEARGREIGRRLEARLFRENYRAYGLGISNLDAGLDRDVEDAGEAREERLRRLGEIARLMTDSGLILISAVPDLDAHDVRILRTLNAPGEILVVTTETESEAAAGAGLVLGDSGDADEAVDRIYALLQRDAVIPDYTI